jgi:hypothetical protein
MSAPEQTLNGTTAVIGKFHRVCERHGKRLVETPVPRQVVIPTLTLQSVRMRIRTDDDGCSPSRAT